VGAMQKTAIIIPCYNEENRLDSKKFYENSTRNPEVHFIFMNDGSTDKTEEILDALCRKNPTRMRQVTLQKNVGKAEAIRKGFLSAFEQNFERIGYWDADLATPLDIIPKFCEIMDYTGKNIVMGARVRLLGRNIQRRAIRGQKCTTGAEKQGQPVRHLAANRGNGPDSHRQLRRQPLL